MAQQYPSVLSNESIEWLFSQPEVSIAKSRIIANTMDHASEYFTVLLTQSIRKELFESMGLQLSNISSIPMRWIKGDIPAHSDNGVDSFTHTHLVYLTNSNGSLIVDGVTYPIQRGYGYVFPEGLTHETVGTNSDTEPRLLLGPMSETGFAVGAAQLYLPGGTTVYIRQTAVGQELEYSTNQVDWSILYLVGVIQNSNTSAGLLTIEFVTDITIDTTIGGNNGYFVCYSDYIQIGSRILKPDGTRPVITINGITNYDGFIQNGTNNGGSNGYNNIYIMNLEIRATGGSHLVNGGGWVCQGHFGKNTTASSNIIINCHSDGLISNDCGGIVGHYCGPVKCISCSSSGYIHDFAGGIIGSHSPATTGLLRCESCWTTGEIGHFGGGITGESTGGATIVNCYSTGAITENAGGISGRYTGGTGGGNDYTVSECYSMGSISDRAGGILGSDVGVVVVSNCYSTGVIAIDGGGIIGTVPSGNNTNKVIANCYTTGITAHTHGYIVPGYTNVNTNLTIGSGTITMMNNYSEAANSSSGWSNAHANTVLVGAPASSSAPVGAKWVYAGINMPYELYFMGYTPYTRAMVIGSPTSPTTLRSFVNTASAGTTTAGAIISGRSYSILQITGGSVGSYATISMNNTTGAITTTRATALGTYTLTVRNNGSYHITTYILTVTEATAEQHNPCRFFGLFTNNAQVYYKPHSLPSGGIGTVRNHRRKARKT